IFFSPPAAGQQKSNYPRLQQELRAVPMPESSAARVSLVVCCILHVFLSSDSAEDPCCPLVREWVFCGCSVPPLDRRRLSRGDLECFWAFQPEVYLPARRKT